MKTIFNYLPDISVWKRVKNHCRTTVGKEFTENEATDEFKKKLLISEHSPIRLLEFDWSWNSIKYWVSTEWSRHKFEKFIKSQRNDRQNNYDRNKAPQDALVNFDGYANMQNLIDTHRKRLCYQATNEARELAENFKRTLYSEGCFNEAEVLVPNCIYRCGCPEFSECGFYKKLVADNPLAQSTNIAERYEAYNQWFWRFENGTNNN